MEMLLKSVWTKTLLSRLVSRSIKKKSGYDLSFSIQDLELDADDKEVKLHLDVDIKTTPEQLTKILKSMGA